MKRAFYLVLVAGAVLALCGCEWGRMWETPGVRPHEEPLLVMDDGAVAFEAPEALLRVAAPEDLFCPFDASVQTVAMGKTGYFTYCVHCHGKYHDGNGTVGQSFSPLPGDLRSQKVQAALDGLIFKEISYGIPNGRQPPLATTIDVGDRWRIVRYVKSLGVRE